MFSMLWYASRRLRSCCISAYSTPSTAEMPPIATTKHAPGQPSACPDRTHRHARFRRCPALMSTADMKAEMLVGAAGCASGSQTWKRNDARLHAEPEEEEREHPITQRPRHHVARQQCRRTTTTRTAPPSIRKPGDQTAGADVRHHQIQVRRRAGLRALRVRSPRAPRSPASSAPTRTGT